MRHLFTWLLVFGVLAGLSGRVLASSKIETCSHPQQECCGTAENHPAPTDHHHDDKCPPDHHHHCGGCVHNLPLSVESDLIHRLPLLEYSLSHLRHESEMPPDGPFPALDKPPLI